jgi:hypothetical protein
MVSCDGAKPSATIHRSCEIAENYSLRRMQLSSARAATIRLRRFIHFQFDALAQQTLALREV